MAKRKFTKKTQPAPTKNLQIVEFSIGLCTTAIIAVLVILYVIPVVSGYFSNKETIVKPAPAKKIVRMSPVPKASTSATLSPTYGPRKVTVTVANGDGIYAISMKACGNDSYYQTMMTSGKDVDFSPGQKVEVTCN